MKARANTRVTIYRGTVVDVYDDEVDANDNSTVAASGVLAALSEQSRRVYLPAEGATRVVRTSYCRVGYEVDVRKDDRIKDEATGVIYVITELPDPPSILGFAPDQVLTISRTT